jgi:CRISPR-associated protein Cas2
MLFLVSYDIINDNRRTKLAKRLLDYGKRVQFSVFECNLARSKYVEMKKEILDFVNEEEDSLRIYKLCQNCFNKIESIGVKEGYESGEKAIIV